MTLRKALTLLASYFGFIAALTVVVCLAFGTRIRTEKDMIGQAQGDVRNVKKQIKNSTLEEPHQRNKALESEPSVLNPQNQAVTANPKTPSSPALSKQVNQPEKRQAVQGQDKQNVALKNQDDANAPGLAQSSTKKTNSILKYTLEVKVYRDFESAEALRQDLAKNKIRAYIVPSTINSETFFRVRVGKFKTEAKAIETSKMFHRATQIPTRIVKM